MTAISCHRHLALLCLAAATARRGVPRYPRGADAGGSERSDWPTPTPVAAPLVPVATAAVR